MKKPKKQNGKDAYSAMSCTKYPHMFQPMTIKGVTFKNRVLASPITTNRIVDHGYPTPEGIDV